MLDYERERAAHEELRQFCRSVEFVVRRNDRNPHLASITPHAVHEFQTPELEWLIQRQILLHQIDVVQLEYTALGQYARPFSRLVCALFEHDMYFQSIGRALPFMRSPFERLKARFEYIRAIRYELSLLPRCDHIQVCTLENKSYIESFLPKLAPRVDAGLRAGVDSSLYAYPGGPRRPRTMLFLGSFRHTPNQVALDWFTREVLPLVLTKLPDARLLVAELGSAAAPRFSRSGERHRPAGFRGRYSAAVCGLCCVYLPDSQRFRRPRETAGSIRQRNSGGFDNAGRRRSGPQRRRVLRGACR